MPQSLSWVIVHIVFSTKDRRPFLNAAICESIYPYLATVARNAGCECYRVGGTENHIHLAVRLSRTGTIANLVEELKSSSSKWLKTQSENFKNFSWQRGYACFSISLKELDALIDYIDRQKEHHLKRTFQEELRILLSQHGVQYDEAYVWD